MPDPLKILFVAGSQAHGHDYLSGAVFDGLKAAIEERGRGYVIAYRDPKWLHLREDPQRPGSCLPLPSDRDECGLDSDAAFPVTRLPDGVGGPYDLVVGSIHAKDDLRDAARENGSVPMAVIDGGDSAQDRSSEARETVGGAMRWYFKRELATGAGGAIPFPLTYPLRRAVTEVESERPLRVCYYATSSNGNAPGRMEIENGLRAACRGPSASDPRGAQGECDVRLFAWQKDRPTPEDLHQRLLGALVGVHWNPYAGRAPFSHGWDGNRFWENAAHGLVNVSLRPWIQIPDPFIDGLNVVWVDRASDVAGEVRRLLDHPERALSMARASLAHFRAHHSSVARARYLLKHCGFWRAEWDTDAEGES